MKKVFVTLILILFGFANANDIESQLDKNLRSEFTITLDLYLTQLSRNIGFYFQLDNRNCIENKELSTLIRQDFGISTDPNSSVYDHLRVLAENLGNDYNITIDLPLKTISLSCADKIKIKTDVE